MQSASSVPQLARPAVPPGGDRRRAMVPLRAVELYGAGEAVAAQPAAAARAATRRRAPRGPLDQEAD